MYVCACSPVPPTHLPPHRYLQELKDDFDANGTNTITRAYAYTGFAPLVKDCEGWAKAIARFNPNMENDGGESSDSNDEVMDPYAEAEEAQLRKEGRDLAKEVHTPHHRTQTHT